MTYQQALEKIHSLDTFGSRPGLDRIKRFLDILGNPQDSLKFIHIAGTNGKGSTCAMTSSVLVSQGYKTGLFISPYITDFCERIQINGKPVDHNILSDAVEETFPTIIKLRQEDCIITEFEYVMALAFLIFKRLSCQVVVLEVGLGGLLDCTNVILPPVASVITTIDLDHTNVLGNTIEEIANQKCGIIKTNSPVITSNQQESVFNVIKTTCDTKKCKLYQSKQINAQVVSQSIKGTVLNYNGIQLNLPLVGAHQIENCKTALATLEAISESFPITKENLTKGIANAVNPARFEVLSYNPLVILDGAHNPNGINALKNAINTLVPTKNNICVLGMLADKDSQKSIKLLSGLFNTVITTNVNNPRNLDCNILGEKCKPYFDNVICCDTPRSAFDKGLQLAKNLNGSLVIAGSLYLAGEIRPYILKNV